MGKSLASCFLTDSVYVTCIPMVTSICSIAWTANKINDTTRQLRFERKSRDLHAYRLITETYALSNTCALFLAMYVRYFIVCMRVELRYRVSILSARWVTVQCEGLRLRDDDDDGVSTLRRSLNRRTTTQLSATNENVKLKLNFN